MDFVSNPEARSSESLRLRDRWIEPSEIEAHLLRHPQVKRSVVLVNEDEVGEPQLIAHVMVDLGESKAQGESGLGSVKTGITDRWKTLYDLTYSSAANKDPSFAGWNSSYTRQPIPEAEMREWLLATVDRIRTLRPSSLLEIGCGSGLLVQHLAPECIRYVGTDFSPSALERLKQWISRRGNLVHVELLQRSAMELQDLAPGSFDTVVLNSVIQYFPNIEYLLTVLEHATRLLVPGGKIFVGDVRHLGLLPMFHSAVQLSRASDSLTVTHLRTRITRALAHEMELAIDPQFFRALPTHLSRITAVDVQVKVGRASNELTRYRYDVVLHTDEHLREHPTFETRLWRADSTFSAEIEAALQEKCFPALRLISIPNSRLAREAAVRKLIDSSDARTTTASLRRQLDGWLPEKPDLESFHQWGERYGYNVAIGWGTAQSPEDVDLLLSDRARAGQIPPVPPSLSDLRPWHEYANSPLDNGIRQRLIPQLREHLRSQLPEHLIPTTWILS